MNIALVAQEYFPEKARGGIGTQTSVKAQGLVQLGHSVYVIARSIDSQKHKIVFGNLTEIFIPGMENRISEMTDIVQWITHSTLVAEEIEILNSQVGIDIIDFAEWAAEGYVYLLNRTPWKSIPCVIQLHGPLVMFTHTMNWPNLNSEFYRTGTHMEAACTRLADAVYSSSTCSANWVRKFYDPCKEEIPVIHSGVDTNKFAPKATSKYSRPTIIFVGKVVQNKGVEELVDAALELVKLFPNLQVKIFGRGKEEEIIKFQQKANACSAPDLLTFPGFISKEELPDELSKAHVFAAPSHYEGGPGFVYLEAMACGIPVIGCSGSGVDEIITNNKNGLLVPPRDAKALYSALLKILTDNKLADTLGNAGRDFVLTSAETKNCLKKLEAFYLSVIEKKNSPMEVEHA